MQDNKQSSKQDLHKKQHNCKQNHCYNSKKDSQSNTQVGLQINVNAKKPRRMGRGATAVVEKPKDFKGTIKKLLKYLRIFRVSLFVVIVFAASSAIFNIIGPKILSQATTELFQGILAKIDGTGSINFEAIGWILLTTLGLYGLSGVCSFVQHWLMTNVTQKTCYNMRRDIEAKMDKMPYGYFEKVSVGDTLSRITNDVDTLGQSLNQGLTQMITSVTTIIGVVVMMFSINVFMTFIALLVIPVAIVLTAIVVKFSQKQFRAQQNKLGETNGLVEETFSGHEIIKAFNQEEVVKKKFDKTNKELFEAGWKAQFLSGLLHPAMNFVSNLGYVAVAIAGAIFAVQGIITVGDIQAFIQYVKNLTNPITQLASVANTFQQMAAALERIFEFLEESEESTQHSNLDITKVGSQIDFDHVVFGYNPDTPIIQDFSAHIDKGQTVALVGPSGAGKTTIVKLLMRFYDVDKGVIKLGGYDLRDFTRAQIRSQFGMVLQETWLTNASIRENIRYGRLNATDKEVEEAAKHALAHHFIMTLPGGYDFKINEDASNISQGQRQLLTIARAMLADRRMLILDEATSSVDTRTEIQIQQAMDSMMIGRTSFVIAHRLSTIKKADLILVIKDGDVVESGTHEFLLENKGFYADLYKSQFEACKD